MVAEPDAVQVKFTSPEVVAVVDAVATTLVGAVVVAAEAGWATINSDAAATSIPVIIKPHRATALLSNRVLLLGPGDVYLGTAHV